MLLAVSIAATNAFLIARGVGRPLAQRVIEAEMGHEGKGAISQKLAEVQRVIEGGGFARQFTAIMLLRLTPVVPFSGRGCVGVRVCAWCAGCARRVCVWRGDRGSS